MTEPALRICAMRDGPCPHGLDCPYVGDGYSGYPCKDGWQDRRVTPPAPAPSAGELDPDEISPYEWLALEFERLMVLRKMWRADEVAAIIRRHDIERAAALSTPSLGPVEADVAGLVERLRREADGRDRDPGYADPGFTEDIREAADTLAKLAGQLREDEGDALCLRGYIKEFGETPSMTASRASIAEARVSALTTELEAVKATLTEEFRVSASRSEHVERLQETLMRVHNWIANSSFNAGELAEAEEMDDAVLTALQPRAARRIAALGDGGERP